MSLSRVRIRRGKKIQLDNQLDNFFNTCEPAHEESSLLLYRLCTVCPVLREPGAGGDSLRLPDQQNALFVLLDNFRKKEFDYRSVTYVWLQRL